MTVTLEVDSVTLTFGDRRILSDVFMHFEVGQVTGILGRNGTGKSSLLNIIYGSRNAQYSSVRYNGETVSSAYQYNNRIRYLPQFSIFPKFLKLSSILTLYDISSEMLVKDFEGFKVYLNTSFGKLSFGQKRLFETYIFLKSTSDFILLDEPFSYLMPVNVEKLKEIIREEKNQKGIVITDHLYQNVIDISDSIYLIYDSIARKIKDISELQSFGYLADSLLD
jgi:ABC-type multidrug transport system ATPase subunit